MHKSQFKIFVYCNIYSRIAKTCLYKILGKLIKRKSKIIKSCLLAKLFRQNVTILPYLSSCATRLFIKKEPSRNEETIARMT